MYRVKSSALAVQVIMLAEHKGRTRDKRYKGLECMSKTALGDCIAVRTVGRL